MLTQQERIDAALRKIENIVCTEGCDKGVVMLSYDAPTHYDPEQKCQVYDHEHFSPLGDALIDLFEFLQGKHDHVECPNPIPPRRRKA